MYSCFHTLHRCQQQRNVFASWNKLQFLCSAKGKRLQQLCTQRTNCLQPIAFRGRIMTTRFLAATWVLFLLTGFPSRSLSGPLWWSQNFKEFLEYQYTNDWEENHLGIPRTTLPCFRLWPLVSGTQNVPVGTFWVWNSECASRHVLSLELRMCR